MASHRKKSLTPYEPSLGIRPLVAAAIFFLCNCGSELPDPSMCISDWELHLPHTNEWLPVQVPGDAMIDLLHHKRVPDPFFGTNEHGLQWIENENWVYRTFVLTSSHAAKSVLRFEGLDTYATILVNDSCLLKTDNAHRAYEIALPMNCDTWEIEVTLHSPVNRGQTVLDKQPRYVPVSNEMKPIGEQTSSVTRKPYYHFGWDWGPRLVSAGISGPVYILPAQQPQASANRIQTEFKPDGASVISFEPENHWPAGTWILCHPDGIRDSLSIDARSKSFNISSPVLWWPRGMGEQPLYTLIWSPESSTYQSIEWKIGLRTLEWIRERDQWGYSFECHVNGIPLHARGANVIPSDFFSFRCSESELLMLQSAVDANMNMVRVWGGASYPSDQFYDFCDSTGLLVWQDFMFACAMVPGDSAYLNNVNAEALHQVRRLRHRPSLAMWCGNNESQKAWNDWGWPDAFDLHGADSVATEQAYAAVFHEILPSVVSSESNTAYWPSSPSTDSLAQPGLPSGDVHAWRVWFDTLDFDYFSTHGGRFVSEYGLQSLPDASTLSKVGIDAFADEALQFRQRSKMDWLKPGLDGWGMMRIYAKRYAADPAAEDPDHTPLDRWIYLTQFAQALGLREALERHRTSDGRFAGSLYWQLSDVWPAVSWSTVDYYGHWKLAHYAVKHANKTRCVQRAHGHLGETLYAFNDNPKAIDNSELRVSLLDIRGDTLQSDSFTIDVPAFSHYVIKLGEEFDGKKGILRWKWIDDGGQLVDVGDWIHKKPAEVNWPEANIEKAWFADSLVLKSNQLVIGVRLQLEGIRFDENGFILFPDEPKSVGFHRIAAQAAASNQLTLEHFAQFQ